MARHCYGRCAGSSRFVEETLVAHDLKARQEKPIVRQSGPMKTCLFDCPWLRRNNASVDKDVGCNVAQ